jgi:hypothetical protein
LTILLLLLAFEVEAENGFIHDTGQQKHPLYLFFFWYSSQLILESNSDLGFEEFPFLLCGGHALSVPKLNTPVKYWDFDFGMGFETGRRPCFGGLRNGGMRVPKTVVFGTTKR